MSFSKAHIMLLSRGVVQGEAFTRHVPGRVVVVANFVEGGQLQLVLTGREAAPVDLQRRIERLIQPTCGALILFHLNIIIGFFKFIFYFYANNNYNI